MMHRICVTDENGMLLDEYWTNETFNEIDNVMQMRLACYSSKEELEEANQAGEEDEEEEEEEDDE